MSQWISQAIPSLCPRFPHPKRPHGAHYPPKRRNAARLRSTRAMTAFACCTNQEGDDAAKKETRGPHLWVPLTVQEARSIYVLPNHLLAQEKGRSSSRMGPSQKERADDSRSAFQEWS